MVFMLYLREYKYRLCVRLFDIYTISCCNKGVQGAQFSSDFARKEELHRMQINSGSTRRRVRLVPAYPLGARKEALMPATNSGSARRSVQLVAAPKETSQKVSTRKVSVKSASAKK